MSQCIVRDSVYGYVRNLRYGVVLWVRYIAGHCLWNVWSDGACHSLQGDNAIVLWDPDMVMVGYDYGCRDGGIGYRYVVCSGYGYWVLYWTPYWVLLMMRYVQ